MEKYIGKMLDNRYEILEIIGMGGMAVVYKARCHRLNRFVAVKILKDEFSQDAEFRRRFHAESQAVAMLSHPNIVAVYDVSRSSEVEYIVMELIDGITLKQYMQRKGAMSWRETLHFVTQIVKALSHAHGRGIIHRDIKPHNIMILRDGSVKVADFGIARLASTQNTLTQETLGSVHYISPEQARGSHIDARSDLYSVGVVMYEMLTGRLPYEGDTAVSVAIQHINSMPLLPREVNPDIPEALEVITMKAMSAALTRRYASAEAMLSDLEEFRKNPSIVFDYDLVGMHPQDRLLPEEPTKPLQVAQTRQALVQQRTGRDTQPAAPPRKPRPGGRPPEADPEEEDYQQRRKNSTLTVIVGVLAVLVFVGGLVFLLVTLLGDVVSPPVSETVVVPNLVRMNFEAAVSSYEDRFEIVKSEERADDSVPAGYIISQTPTANASVKLSPRAKIEVIVSLGTKSVRIPDNVNREYREVVNALEAVGLKVGDPVMISDEDIVKGYVIRSEPPQYATVTEGETVILYVSDGPSQKNVKVPNLVGMNWEDAQREVLRMGLVNGSPVRVASDEPVDTVVWQSFPAGEEVPEKSLVTLQISVGPAETPSPSPEPSVPPSIEPSPTPTPTPTPPPDPITRTLSFNLAPYAANPYVTINVYVAGQLDYSGTVATSDGAFYRPVTGQPDDMVRVEVDGVVGFQDYLRNIS
ncbi:MAG: Stk1 family PASTA domain-containing Ser/Thr kinase [Oscillospiraceae bacterium]|jgi:serine/threonine-protein kinase|nr:Stk1 family PASTA domain-containing Ser/Thr kinase [Oscillospiraceae bacterium]